MPHTLGKPYHVAATGIMAVLIALMLWGCRQMPEEARRRSYRDAQQRFATDVPRGWATQKDGPSTVFLVSLPGTGRVASVTVTVSIEPAETSSRKSPEDMLERLRRQLAAQPMYQEDRSSVVTHPNGLRAAYLEAVVASDAIDGPPRRLRLYGFPLDDRQVLLKALMPADLSEPHIISATNTILPCSP